MSDYAFTGEAPENHESAQPAPFTEADRVGEELDLYGSGFFDAVRVIETGIEKSHRKGYAIEKVRLGEHEIPLQQYLATEIFRMKGRQELTKEGVDEIFRRYLATPEKQELDKQKAVVNLGQRAVAPYQSGKHRYTDVRSAAANDDTFDD